jgi:peptidoglycan/LPS O-acetylase OafA/YrhL
MRKYSKSEIENLACWRGLLSLIVMAAHVSQIIVYPIIGDTGAVQDVIGTMASLSVCLFFLMSGMLVTYSATTLYKNNLFNFKQYLINRFTRIYPSLITVLLFSTFLSFVYSAINGSPQIIKLDYELYIAREEYSFNWLDFMKTLLMLHPGISQVNGPLWTLYIEWWFYVACIFIYPAIFNKKNYILLLFSMFPLSVAFYGYGIRMITYLVIYAVGCTYTVLSQEYRVVFLSLTSKLALFILTFSTVWTNFSILNIDSSSWYSFSVFQISLSILFIKIILNFNMGKIFKKISNFSYTLYIMHFPTTLFVFATMHKLNLDKYFKSILMITISLLASILLSYLFSIKTENKIFFRNFLMKYS